MTKLERCVEAAANILIVLVSVSVLSVLVYKYLSPTGRDFNEGSNLGRESRMATIKPGQKINVEGIPFEDASRTILIAMQTTCRFCHESMPFYKRLVEEAKRKNVKLVAVFPTDIKSSSEYLREFGIADLEVLQMPLTAISATGTPTLIIIDSNSEVLGAWVGKLTPSSEDEVLNQLN